MLLKDWMCQEGLTAPSLAKALGVTHQAVYSWMHGKSYPRVRYVSVIERMSKGAVRAQDFHPEGEGG